MDKDRTNSEDKESLIVPLALFAPNFLTLIDFSTPCYTKTFYMLTQQALENCHKDHKMVHFECLTVNVTSPWNMHAVLAL